MSNFDKLQDRVRAYGSDSIICLVSAISLVQNGIQPIKEDERAIAQLEKVLDSIEKLDAKLKNLKKLQLLIECEELFERFVFGPLLNKQRNDLSIIDAEACNINEVPETACKEIIERLQIQLRDCHKDHPETSAPTAQNIEYWTNLTAIMHDYRNSTARDMSGIALKALFYLGADQTPNEELMSGHKPVARQRVRRRKQMEKTGSPAPFSVGNLMECKCLLLQEAYQKIAWFDPQQNFLSAFDLYVPPGNKRATAIANSVSSNRSRPKDHN